MNDTLAPTPQKRWWKYVLAVMITALHIIPLYILVGVAFKARTDLSSKWFLPDYITWENFHTALFRGNMLNALINTTLITGLAIILITIFGALAAYPLSRNMSRINGLVKGFVMGIMMVPPLSVLVPLYSTMVKMGGVSEYWGIIIVLVTFYLPLSIYIFSNFIRTIPITLEEAALIDGCSPMGTFFRIILPQLKPAIASVVIITGVYCWNDYQFSLYLLQSPDVQTVTLAISSFFSLQSNDLNAAAASALLGIIPVVILFIFLQKYFIKGMIDSAIK